MPRRFVPESQRRHQHFKFFVGRFRDFDFSSVGNASALCAPGWRTEVPDTPVAKQIEALANTAGLQAHAASIAVACATVVEATTRITAAKEIMALCAVAKRPDDAGQAIRANKSVADVRAALITAMAEADEHTNNAPPARGSQTAGQPGVLSAKAVYEKRAARKQTLAKGN